MSAVMEKKLEKEFNYFLNNQESLVKIYDGKFIVIVGEEVVGSYNSEIEALTECSKKYERGTFLIQLCAPGDQSYRQTFHSRVMFA